MLAGTPLQYSCAQPVVRTQHITARQTGSGPDITVYIAQNRCKDVEWVMNSAALAHSHLNVEHHSGSELGTKGDLLLPYLQQLRSLLPSLQAPVLCQTCAVQLILAIQLVRLLQKLGIIFAGRPGIIARGRGNTIKF